MEVFNTVDEEEDINKVRARWVFRIGAVVRYTSIAMGLEYPPMITRGLRPHAITVTNGKLPDRCGHVVWNS